MKKWIVLLFAGGMSGSYAAQTLPPLTVGIDPTFPPFEYMDDSGHLTGFDVQLGEEICERIHRHCTFVSLPFDSLIPALQARKFDIILSSLSINNERKKSVDFSLPLFSTPVYLIAAKSSPLVANAASLKGHRVGVQQGSVFETYADKYWRPQGVEVVSYQSPDQIYTDLIAGRLDASLDDAVSATFSFLKKPQGAGYALKGREVTDTALFGQGTGIGFRKGEDLQLQQQVNQAIAGIYSDGSFAKLSHQWFTFNVAVQHK
ncbi:ABC transporter substrate-binding protein [Tatumella morbirosei]|uniref:ABC transporter substrate-binding protein n=1 Tax=Tatumella morbirosei TaxID=642227 RepID=A0A095TSC1_9GAMM|nr:transporter substrate-binding domain-containing protein [Tatumella morbirosei]KGD79464.1 ABC transporter substrate-binding protein [Tatumella morbirosei]